MCESVWALNWQCWWCVQCAPPIVNTIELPSWSFDIRSIMLSQSVTKQSNRFDVSHATVSSVCHNRPPHYWPNVMLTIQCPHSSMTTFTFVPDVHHCASLCPTGRPMRIFIQCIILAVHTALIASWWGTTSDMVVVCLCAVSDTIQWHIAITHTDGFRCSFPLTTAQQNRSREFASHGYIHQFTLAITLLQSWINFSVHGWFLPHLRSSLELLSK